MSEERSSFMLVDIAWSISQWKKIEVNPKVSHKYAKNHPPHECINFDFNKSDANSSKIDSDEKVHGYFHSHKKPTKFVNGGLVFFYSKSTEDHENYVVGVYGGVMLQDPILKSKVIGFENDEYWSNMTADPDLSTLFTCAYLLSDRYKEKSGRMVGQVQFKYIEETLAQKILSDARDACLKANDLSTDHKLERIKDYAATLEEAERKQEQEELDALVSNWDIEKVKERLAKYTSANNRRYRINGKAYRRDTEIIAMLKRARGYECQICHKSVPRASGPPYIEGAHITSKHKEGSEAPWNILILCPNHHKEFDLYPAHVKDRNKEMVKFEMDRKDYTIQLTF